MDLKLGYGEPDATMAQGIVVVIDVLRACTTICALLHYVTDRIVVVQDAKTALRLRENKIDWIAIGERRGKPLPGFDLGNSPTDAEAIQRRYSAAVMTTSNGTRSVLAARHAPEVLCAGFVNITATLEAIKTLQPKEVLFVAAGNRESECEADNLCADLMHDRLRGKTWDLNEVRRLILASPAANRFINRNDPAFPQADLELALDEDRYDFAVRVTQRTARSCTLESNMVWGTSKKGRTR